MKRDLLALEQPTVDDEAVEDGLRLAFGHVRFERVNLAQSGERRQRVTFVGCEHDLLDLGDAVLLGATTTLAGKLRTMALKYVISRAV